LHYKSSFKREILNIKENRLFLANREEIQKNDFEIILTFLSEQKKYSPKLYEEEIKNEAYFLEDYFDKPKFNNPSSIFLTTLSNELIEKRKSSGYLLFNTSKKKWIEDYRRLSFDCKFTTTIEVKPDHENTKSYDFKEYNKYSLPTNTILLIDPWITTWNIEKIKANIFRLFDNLFFTKDNKANNKIKIISIYNKLPNEKYKPAKPKNIKEEISSSPPCK